MSGMFGPLRRVAEAAPQTSFQEVYEARARLPAGHPEHVPLAIEDRRSTVRDVTGYDIPGGMMMAALTVPEAVVKAAVAAPGIGPYAERIFKAAGVYEGSRAGQTPFLPTVGGAVTGVLQGLNDRGMFGK